MTRETPRSTKKRDLTHNQLPTILYSDFSIHSCIKLIVMLLWTYEYHFDK